MSNTKKAVIRLLLSPLLKSILKRELILALARKEICATEILSDFPAVLANQQGQNAQRTSGNTVHWVDDWEWYHMALGEVHCGSNVRRAPSGKWWNHTSFFE